MMAMALSYSSVTLANARSYRVKLYTSLEKRIDAQEHLQEQLSRPLAPKTNSCQTLVEYEERQRDRGLHRKYLTIY